MEKAVPDPFPKIKIEHTSDQQLETLYSLFFLYVQVEGYQNMLKLTCWYLALTSWKFFLRNSGLKLVSQPYVLHVFWRKILLTLYSVNWPNFIAFTSWDIGRCIYCNQLFASWWRRKFWNQPLSSYQAVLFRD